LVLFGKIPKLPGRNQAVSVDGLAVGSSNLKFFKENLNFISLFIFYFRNLFEAFQVWRVYSKPLVLTALLWALSTLKRKFYFK
jgi:hypothetical protein